MPQSPPFRVIIPLQNVGQNPASRLKAKLLFVSRTLNEDPWQQANMSEIADDIPNGEQSPWYFDDFYMPENLPPMFIFLRITYGDPTKGNREYIQKFYMRWEGVLNREDYA